MQLENNLAVVIVDMQEPFLAGINRASRKAIIRNQLALIGFCADHDIPVAVLEYHGDKETIKPLLKKLSAVRRSIVIAKSGDNGFTATNLGKQLREWEVDTVLLAGVNASCCVQETAQGALEAGYRILTAKDLMADSHADHCILEAYEWFRENGVLVSRCKELFGLSCSAV